MRCASGSRSSSRTSSASTSRPARTSASAGSRRSTTSTRSGWPPHTPAPTEFTKRLADGYETMLGPEFAGPDRRRRPGARGTDLSVGQWQRIALARAFFRGAPFVILDEPTAALDPRAEQELFDTIRTLLVGRTVLFISHRFSSVRSADRIYVLDEGRVVESGQPRRADGGGRTLRRAVHPAGRRVPRRPHRRATTATSPHHAHRRASRGRRDSHNFPEVVANGAAGEVRAGRASLLRSGDGGWRAGPAHAGHAGARAPWPCRRRRSRSTGRRSSGGRTAGRRRRSRP